MKNPGQRVRELRVAKGFTQLELAQRAHITQPQISEIEKGKANPKIDILQRLSQALNCSISDIDPRHLGWNDTIREDHPPAKSKGISKTDHLTMELLESWSALSKKDKLTALSFIEDLKNKSKGKSCPGEHQTKVA